HLVPRFRPSRPEPRPRLSGPPRGERRDVGGLDAALDGGTAADDFSVCRLGAYLRPPTPPLLQRFDPGWGLGLKTIFSGSTSRTSMYSVHPAGNAEGLSFVPPSWYSVPSTPRTLTPIGSSRRASWSCSRPPPAARRGGREHRLLDATRK